MVPGEHFGSRTCNGMKQELARPANVFACGANFTPERFTSLRVRRLKPQSPRNRAFEAFFAGLAEMR
jgi:hypothetical protein